MWPMYNFLKVRLEMVSLDRLSSFFVMANIVYFLPPSSSAIHKEHDTPPFSTSRYRP